MHSPPFENDILFYDEHLDEEGYDMELIEDLFTSLKRKPIRIGGHKPCKQGDGAVGSNVNQFSRIETEEDENDSDSSIQENITYQALQKIKFPGNIKALSRDNSPDKFIDDIGASPSKTTRKSKAFGLATLGFGGSGDPNNLHNVIEFFDPIKPKGALLSKTKGTGKIKDKGST